MGLCIYKECKDGLEKHDAQWQTVSQERFFGGEGGVVFESPFLKFTFIVIIIFTCMIFLFSYVTSNSQTFVVDFQMKVV